MSSDADKCEVKVFKFGEESLSDVVFVVDGNEFHCHRMVLAARYPYFATMFNSDFKEKTEKRIKMEADPMAFKRLIEILYNGIFEDYEKFFNERPDETAMRAFWSESCALFELADRFLVSDVVQKAFEVHMIVANRKCKLFNCSMCAVKLLLSLHFDMLEYKSICEAGRAAVIRAVRYIKRIQHKVTLPVKDIEFLMERK